MQRLKMILMMVAAKFAAAALTISYKLAQNDGMHMKVLIAYRYLFASILIFPLALFLERNKRPKLTWGIIFHAFLCAILGGPVSQNMYAESITLTSTTFVAAFTNLIPPFTFIVAVMFRLERVEIGKITGKAKVIGTFVGVAGAMILTFYKGHQLTNGSTHFNLFHVSQHMDAHMTPAHKTSSHIFGFILALVYSLFIALFYILQSKLTVKYPCHYTNTFVFSVLGFIQSIVYVVITERSWSQVYLNSHTRLFLAICQGISSILAVILAMVVVRLQGPLFVSVFNPLVLIFVAIASFLALGEKLYVGSLLGSIIIIAGLYLVLWGKSKETKRLSKLTPLGSSKDLNDVSNTIATTISLEPESMACASFNVNVDEGDDLPAKPSRKNHEKQETVEEV